MGYSMDTVELQRISQEMLELYVYDPKTLRKDCPLDHGFHDLSDVRYDLGALMKLPLELRYTVLDKLDVQSLLVFRRTSKAAMTTVNNMVSYQKVIASATDCIRISLTVYCSHLGMAIAIETSHTFTLAQLVSKLAQTHCDGIDCTNLAPYLDVFTLTRRCLSISHGCPNTRAPLTIRHLTMSRWFQEDNIEARMAPMRRFAAIAGKFDDKWRTHGKPIDEDEDDVDTYFYAYEDIKKEFFSDKTKWFFYKQEHMRGARVLWYWKLCSVVAPWIKDKGQVVTGVFCDECECVERYDEEFWPHRAGWAPSIRYVVEHGWDEQEDHREAQWSDPMSVAFMKLEDLDEHKKLGKHTKYKGFH